MSKPVIVTCAVTGGADTVDKHPAIPVTAKEIAFAAIDAGKAGAAIAHIHVREPKTGKVAMELAYYREVVERIRDSGSEILINLTTGPGAFFVPGEQDVKIGGAGTTLSSPAERVRHILELSPDICSLDIASMNFNQAAMINTPRHIREMAAAIRTTTVRPELEVFEPGHIMLARQLIDDGVIAGPALFQICLGIRWGTPATAESMMYMRSLLPEGSMWAAFGISRDEFPMVAQAAILGGHVRVGLEDNLYIEHGVLAKDNTALVEKAVKIVSLLGHSIASPAAAREVLSIRQKTAA